VKGQVSDERFERAVEAVKHEIRERDLRGRGIEDEDVEARILARAALEAVQLESSSRGAV
jgi:hypothetical protein